MAARLPNFLCLMAASVVCVIYGWIDDVRGLSYKWKLLLQFVMAGFLLLSGDRIESLSGLLGIHGLPLIISLLLTVFVVMFLINALNFIDGIDGLAVGLVFLSLVYYGFLFYLTDRPNYVLVVVAMMGSITSFAYFNIFGYKSQRRIFMGDIGSTTLGLFIAWICLQLLSDFPENLVKSASAEFFVTIAPVVFPCCDVVRVIVCRLLEGRSPFMADSNHLHHKLIRAGCSPTQTLIILLLFTFFCQASVLLLRNQNVYLVILLLILIFVCADIFLTFWLKNRTRKEYKDEDKE